MNVQKYTPPRPFAVTLLWIAFLCFAWSNANAEVTEAGRLVQLSSREKVVDVFLNGDSSVRNLIVPIHGWWGLGALIAGSADKYEEESKWIALLQELQTVTAGTDWDVAAYDWSEDCKTLNSVQAAVNGNDHGEVLAGMLRQKFPNMRQVHFIAHSAGTWAAYSCTNKLLTQCPFVVLQLTFLDAYAPPSLGRSLLDNIPFIGNRGERIYRLEHYLDDYFLGATPNTQYIFTWRSDYDQGGQRVDYTFLPPYLRCYDNHSGPIEFYKDTVKYARTGVASACLSSNRSPFFAVGYAQVGWAKGMFAKFNSRPRVEAITVRVNNLTASASSPHATEGQSVVFDPTTANASQFQWYKDGILMPLMTSKRLEMTTAKTDSGVYVLRAATSLPNVIFSDAISLEVTDPPPAPTPENPVPLPPLILNSVTPTSFTAAYQPLRLAGGNFPQDCTLEFRTPSQVIRTSISPVSWANSQTLNYQVHVGSTYGNWAVRVFHAPSSRRSEWRSFTANAPPAPPPPTPTTGSLTVAIGPTGARLAGAQWNIAGGEYRNTAETVSNLPPGAVTVRFKPVTGYNPPADQTANIVAGNLTSIAVTYTAVAAPANYTLSLNAVNGAIGRSPELASYPPGTVVRLWTSPNSGYHFDSWSGDLAGTSSFQDIVMDRSKTITANFALGDWTSTSLTVTLEPAEVRPLLAQWRVDGGAWQNSGVTISNQHLGDNYIEF